jgi:hypothetical protein
VGVLRIEPVTPALPAAAEVEPVRLLLDRDRVVLVDDGSDGNARVVSLPLSMTAGVTTLSSAALLARPDVSAAGITLAQASFGGGVLTVVDTTTTTTVRHLTAQGFAAVRAADNIAFSEFAADPGAPMAVRGNAVFVIGGGKLFPLTRRATTSNHGTAFEFFSPMKQLTFVDNRMLGSIVVNDSGVTGAFARVALITPQFQGADVTAVVEDASFASGIDPANRGGALVDIPWGALFYDRGLSLRVLSANE